jgi:hypothetical protein
MLLGLLGNRIVVAHTGFAIEPQISDFSFEPLKTGFSPKPDFVRKSPTTENT